MTHRVENIAYAVMFLLCNRVKCFFCHTVPIANKSLPQWSFGYQRTTRVVVVVLGV